MVVPNYDINVLEAFTLNAGVEECARPASRGIQKIAERLRLLEKKQPSFRRGREGCGVIVLCEAAWFYERHSTRRDCQSNLKYKSEYPTARREHTGHCVYQSYYD